MDNYMETGPIGVYTDSKRVVAWDAVKEPKAKFSTVWVHGV